MAAATSASSPTFSNGSSGCRFLRYCSRLGINPTDETGITPTNSLLERRWGPMSTTGPIFVWLPHALNSEAKLFRALCCIQPK